MYFVVSMTCKRDMQTTGKPWNGGEMFGLLILGGDRKGINIHLN
jgi:hypothetical protein